MAKDKTHYFKDQKRFVEELAGTVSRTLRVCKSGRRVHINTDSPRLYRTSSLELDLLRLPMIAAASAQLNEMKI